MALDTVPVAFLSRNTMGQPSALYDDVQGSIGDNNGILFVRVFVFFFDGMADVIHLRKLLQHIGGNAPAVLLIAAYHQLIMALAQQLDSVDDGIAGIHSQLFAMAR